MPKTRFRNFGEGPHKKGNVADDSGAELNEMNSPIPTESKVKPEYSSKSTKGMLSQLRGACTAFARSFRPGMSSSSSSSSSSMPPPPSGGGGKTQKKMKTETIEIKNLANSPDTIDDIHGRLVQKGSAQYTREQKLLAVRAVYIYLKQQKEFAECYDEECKEEANSDAMSMSDKAWSMPSLPSAIKETAMRLGIFVRRLSSWVQEFHQIGDICDVSRANKGGIVFIDSIGKLNIFAQMEILEYFFILKRAGQQVTSSKLAMHLATEDRYSDLIKETPSLLPPLNVSHDVVDKALRKMGVLSWGRVERKGGLGKGSDEDKQKKAEAKLWAIRIFIVTYHLDMIEEANGSLMMLMGDESFINLLHRCEFGMLEVDGEGIPISEVPEAPGLGPRLCISDFVSRNPFANGHMVTKNPDGTWVLDCQYQDARGNKKEKGGVFRELNNDFPQKPREVYLRGEDETNEQGPVEPKKIKDMTMPELKAEVTRRNLNPPAEKMLKKDLKKFVLDSRTEEEKEEELKIKKKEVRAPSSNTIK